MLLVLREIEVAARGDAFQFLGAEGKLEKDVHAGAGVVREFVRLLPVVIEHVRAEADAVVVRDALLHPIVMPHLPAPVRLRRGKIGAFAPRRDAPCRMRIASSGLMKNSSSICSNSRERKVKLRGVTSLRNALPIWQMPNGTFCRDESTTFLNCAKIACAVSGRRYALSASVAVAPTIGLEHQVERLRLR